MQIEIRHRTTYRYASPAKYSVQTLRLTPQSFEGQRVVAWKIDAPGIAEALCFRDGLGGDVMHQISVMGEHDTVAVEAIGIVETDDRNGVVRGVCDTAPHRLYLRQTVRTAPDAAIRKLADELGEGVLLARLHELVEHIRDAVDYEIGTTSTYTSGAEALAAGRGVCQDHTHIFLSVARVLGVPARYVTGYLLLDDGAASYAQHAWAEAWVPDLGWVGFDVANRLCPTDAYVRLASGLDAVYAAPLRGYRQGGGDESLDVQVQVQQQASQQ